MKIYIGSENPTKIEAVKNIFTEAEVVGRAVSAQVSAQPFSDQETLEGAINRAKACASLEKGALGAGLEGGVMEIGDDLFLCNWGALVTNDGETYIASGARIPLPEEVVVQLRKGIELGEVMDDYVKKKDVRKKEGAIGIFTNNLVSRSEMFTHVLRLLRGQYDYAQTKKVSG